MARTSKKTRSLGDACQYLKGVGPSRAERLRKLGIESVNDLLTHFPRKYYDRRNLCSISGLQEGVEASFFGAVQNVTAPPAWRRPRRIVATVLDDAGSMVQAVWFNQPYLNRYLKAGMGVVLTGTLSFYRGTAQVVNPEFEVVGDALDADLVHAGRIVPVYPLTAGISQRHMRELMARTLDDYAGVVYENLPATLAEAEDLCARVDALRAIHFPETPEQRDAAVRRLKMEELFYLQLLLALQRRRHMRGPARPRFDTKRRLESEFLASLPFALTGAQRRVIDDIHADLETEAGMHRLLQGDVGSGKTIVAGAALLAACEAGYQAALMVPTEILAIQHARTLAKYLDPLGVRPGLLIGSLKPAEKRAMHEQIAAGEVPIIVGTHALIQEEVRFERLGLVIVDEQHRFGVRQRAALLARNGNPHLLVMTATPIPRTLAMTAYADLDLSVIDELPPGRTAVKTRVVSADKRESMYHYIRDEAEAGRQAYLLYPVIDDTEKQDLEAAVSAHKELSKGVFEGIPLGLLNGRMALAEKEQAMRDFADGRTRVLVTTTVVEVGVDVPQATVMAVHHPERFGLSQLHQLRGRVGRGTDPGYCFLLLGEDVSRESRERVEILTAATDGFSIAEEDLKIRGPGEFFGVRQHGVPALKLVNPALDYDIVETVRDRLKTFLESDPHLRSPEAEPCRRFVRDVHADTHLQTVG